MIAPLLSCPSSCSAWLPCWPTPRWAGATPSSTGLDRHDFLYCGEWQTDRDGEHMYLIRGGKIVWSHAIGDKEEYGDCSMMSTGHILFSRKDGATEIMPDLKSGKGGTGGLGLPGPQGDRGPHRAAGRKRTRC